MPLSVPAIVAIPVRDEAERIGPCLRALAHQQGAAFAAIILVINNTVDGTERVVDALRPSLPVPVVSLLRTLPAEQACAGVARRMGMEHALGLLQGGDGVLFTTDADGIVPPAWLAGNLAHIAAGAEAVAGRAVLLAEDDAALPQRLRDDDALESAYALALDRIDAAIDPIACDPWPRHTEHSGASIAVTAGAYRRAGGMPAVHLAEDRRFFAALAQVDARIRHAPELVVCVSGRTQGRAEGGMADTIRRRLVAPDPYLDTALEPARTRALRARLRCAFRRGWSGAADDRLVAQAGLAAALGLQEACVADAWRARWFGEGWDSLERASPALRRRAVPSWDAVRELEDAQAMLAVLV